MISGLPAIFSVILLIRDPLGTIPWLVVTWSVLVVSGYQIWRINHPKIHPANIARLFYLVLSFSVGAIGLAIVRANPLVLVVVLAVWCAVMALLGLALWSVSRGVKENDPGDGDKRTAERLGLRLTAPRLRSRTRDPASCGQLRPARRTAFGRPAF